MHKKYLLKSLDTRNISLKAWNSTSASDGAKYKFQALIKGYQIKDKRYQSLFVFFVFFLSKELLYEVKIVFIDDVFFIWDRLPARQETTVAFHICCDHSGFPCLD